MDDNEALRELVEEQAALRRVATLVAVERDPAKVFATVAEEAGRLLRARQVSVGRFEGADEALVVGAWIAPGGPSGFGVGSRVTLDGVTAGSLVRVTGRPSRVDDYDEVSGPLVERLRGLGVRSGIAVPIHLAGQLWGMLAIQSERPRAFAPEAEGRVNAFAALVAAALAEAGDRERLETNVAKYADASRVSVRLARENGAASVTVTDDGVGGADPAGGSGLRGLSDRVEALGGRLAVESPPGGGTTVSVAFPMR